MIYCIDTSSLIAGWNERYPQEVFPGLWNNIGDLIEIEQLIAPEVVKFELEKKEDSINNWLDQNKKLFQPLDDGVQGIASNIIADNPTLIDINRTSDQADPFVIALALERNGVVVTEEKRTNSPKRTKIPNVCDAYKIRCIDLLNMIRELKWKF